MKQPAVAGRLYDLVVVLQQIVGGSFGKIDVFPADSAGSLISCYFTPSDGKLSAARSLIPLLTRNKATFARMGYRMLYPAQIVTFEYEDGNCNCVYMLLQLDSISPSG
mgnify:CR=1 FL=1